MTRIARIVVPGETMHIIQRGNNNQPIFFHDTDYQQYLNMLKCSAPGNGCSIHAYALMENHVHLLLTPARWDGVSRMMQVVGRSYARYVNKQYNRSGTLWDGRYKSSLIESFHYLLPCSLYVEFNPVRTGIVKQPGDYRWSSYACNALGRNNELITLHPVYELLGDDHASRSQAYRKMSAELLCMADIERFRRGTEKGSVIGSELFKNKIEALLKRRVRRFNHGGDRKSKVFRNNHALQY